MDQLRALGVSWPPKKGWKKEIIGREISGKLAKIFAVRRPGKEFRPCWNCGIRVNFPLTERRQSDGRKIFHWRDELGNIHSCREALGKKAEEITSDQREHLRSILQEKDSQ